MYEQDLCLLAASCTLMDEAFVKLSSYLMFLIGDNTQGLRSALCCAVLCRHPNAMRLVSSKTGLMQLLSAVMRMALFLAGSLDFSRMSPELVEPLLVLCWLLWLVPSHSGLWCWQSLGSNSTGMQSHAHQTRVLFPLYSIL